jgi:hypothetical protein
MSLQQWLYVFVKRNIFDRGRGMERATHSGGEQDLAQGLDHPLSMVGS